MDRYEQEVAQVLPLLGSGNERVWCAAVDSLMPHKQQVAEPLVVALKMADEPTQAGIFAMLPLIGDAAEAPLRSFLEETTDEESRGRISLAIIALRVPGVLAPLNWVSDDSASAEELRELGRDVFRDYSEIAEALVAFFSDENAYVASAAAKAMESLGGSAVPSLIHALTTQDQRGKSLAQAVLAAIGVPAVEPLVEALASADPMIRYGAMSALKAIGVPAIESLMAQLSLASTEQREAIVMTLGQIGTPARQALLDIVEHYPEIARHAATQLAILRIPSLGPVLAAMGNIASLPGAGADYFDAHTVNQLVSELSEQCKPLRRMYQTFLILAGQPAVSPLVSLFALPEPSLRRTALDTLTHMGPLPVPTLISALAHRNSAVRDGAFLALVDIGRPAIAPCMDWLTASADADVRTKMLLIALGEIGAQGGTPAVDQLITYVLESDKKAAVLATAALAGVGTPAMHQLQRVVEGSDEDRSVKALEAMKDIYDYSPPAVMLRLSVEGKRNSFFAP